MNNKTFTFIIIIALLAGLVTWYLIREKNEVAEPTQSTPQEYVGESKGEQPPYWTPEEGKCEKC